MTVTSNGQRTQPMEESSTYYGADYEKNISIRLIAVLDSDFACYGIPRFRVTACLHNTGLAVGQEITLRELANLLLSYDIRIDSFIPEDVLAIKLAKDRLKEEIEKAEILSLAKFHPPIRTKKKKAGGE